MMKNVKGWLSRTISLLSNAHVVRHNAAVSLDHGYEMVRGYIGRGKYSHVHLVRRTQDGKLFAWKIPTKYSREKNYYPLQKHVGLHKIWTHAGLTQSEMVLSQDATSIFHEYIHGVTLRECYKTHPGFLGNFHHPLTKSLDCFVGKMLSQALVFKDLHTRNLVYDGRQWHIIDSQSPKHYDSPRRAWKKMYRWLYLGTKQSLGKWRLPYHPLQRRHLKRYMHHVEHDLLPAIEAAYTGPSPALLAQLRTFRTHVQNRRCVSARNDTTPAFAIPQC